MEQISLAFSKETILRGHSNFSPCRYQLFGSFLPFYLTWGFVGCQLRSYWPDGLILLIINESLPWNGLSRVRLSITKFPERFEFCTQFMAEFRGVIKIEGVGRQKTIARCKIDSHYPQSVMFVSFFSQSKNLDT